MSEKTSAMASWVFIVIAVISGVVLFNGWSTAGASDDHEEAREMRSRGDIIPLSGLLERVELEGMKIIEAELEKEDGQVVYELELLDPNGKVFERYYNAVTGELIKEKEED